MYANDRLGQTTTIGKIAGTCVLCTALMTSPVESRQPLHYTTSILNQAFDQKLTSMPIEEIIMSDDIRDKVIVLETKVSAIESEFKTVGTLLSEIKEDISGIKGDIKVLNESASDNKWWIRGGLTGIFVAGAGAFWYIFNLLKEILIQLPKH